MRFLGAFQAGTVLFSLFCFCLFDASFHPAAAMPQLCRDAQSDNLNVPGAHEVFEACTFVTMTCAFSSHSNGSQAAEDKCVEDQFRNGARNSDPNSPDTIYIRAHLSGSGPAHPHDDSHRNRHSELIDKLLDGCSAHVEAKARIEGCTALIQSSENTDERALGLLGRMNAYLMTNNYRSTIDDANSVLALGDHPEDAGSALLMRGTAYHLLKQYDRAVADLTRAIQLRPEDNILQSAYYRRGQVYFDTAEYKLAAVDYAKYVGLAPQGQGAENAYFKRAEALGHLHRYGEALDDLSSCLRINPKNAPALALRDTYENTLLSASAQN